MKLYKYIPCGICFLALPQKMHFWYQFCENVQKKANEILCNLHKISIFVCALAQHSTAQHSTAQHIFFG
ncbi:hypothetical protein CGC58_02675 [Capnocytophaga stomatis]|uniref:Uncharacterized protein n=1 Tax=Capnocytophaga stomatis TaxID=1848904 RepID=A0A250FUA6_9FLAO|nr:hypothetical protein CGC58_02675 [Capnocytophaga stomatis]